MPRWAGIRPCPAAVRAPSRSARNSHRAMPIAQCQVSKVFQAVCFRAPSSGTDQATVAAIKASFKSGRLQTQAGVPAVRCRLSGPVRERRNEPQIRCQPACACRAPEARGAPRSRLHRAPDSRHPGSMRRRGAPTMVNQQSTPPSSTANAYTGPAAANADVQAFQDQPVGKHPPRQPLRRLSPPGRASRRCSRARTT